MVINWSLPVATKSTSTLQNRNRFESRNISTDGRIFLILYVFESKVRSGQVSIFMGDHQGCRVDWEIEKQSENAIIFQIIAKKTLSGCVLVEAMTWAWLKTVLT